MAKYKFEVDCSVSKGAGNSSKREKIIVTIDSPNFSVDNHKKETIAEIKRIFGDSYILATGIHGYK